TKLLLPMAKPPKVGLLVVVRCWPVLNCRCVSVIPSVVTATEVELTVIPEPAPIARDVDPPRATEPPPVKPLPAVTVSAPELTKFAFAKVPATPAVPKSTALVVEPEPMKIEAVNVLDTMASVIELAGKEIAPLLTVKPLA